MYSVFFYLNLTFLCQDDIICFDKQMQLLKVVPYETS